MWTGSKADSNSILDGEIPGLVWHLHLVIRPITVSVPSIRHLAFCCAAPGEAKIDGDNDVIVWINTVFSALAMSRTLKDGKQQLTSSGLTRIWEVIDSTISPYPSQNVIEQQLVRWLEHGQYASTERGRADLYAIYSEDMEGAQACQDFRAKDVSSILADMPILSGKACQPLCRYSRLNGRTSGHDHENRWEISKTWVAVFCPCQEIGALSSLEETGTA
ncbi:hypothetical protein EGW08_013589 [Elysia chlorotica]|uniref:Uncharacterized protein n=1 Tax=Elysia chlorotica TaxID=188477 RepID=A0A3S0ZMV0_ELYCH|nr:hypothetical protein EGW08_013589 [Elysia chlorotica]